MRSFVPKSTATLLAITILLVTTTVLFAQNNKYYIEALTAENVGWRVSAAQLLGEAGANEAVDALITMLKTDESSGARITAAVALTKIGDQKAYRALRYASRYDKNQTVRNVARGAVMELEKLRTKEKNLATTK